MRHHLIRRLSTFLPAPAKDLQQASGACRLDRGVVHVSGPDAAKFLNGLCTSNVLNWHEDPAVHGRYALFLNAQGRLLYDTFIHRLHRSDAFLVECARSVATDFALHLRQYRLRSKVQVVDESELWQIEVLWRNGLVEGAIRDERCDWDLQRRPIAKTEQERHATLLQYDLLRFLKGIPEGPQEMPRGKAIPMEYNADLMNAIDLQKGCYLGQELITRTLHRGVVRNRILPIQIFSKDTSESALSSNLEGLSVGSDLVRFEPEETLDVHQVTKIHPEKVFGKIVTVLGNAGLAMVRLEQRPHSGHFAVHCPHPATSSANFVLGKAELPAWWPPSIKTN